MNPTPKNECKCVTTGKTWTNSKCPLHYPSKEEGSVYEKVARHAERIGKLANDKMFGPPKEEGK